MRKILFFNFESGEPVSAFATVARKSFNDKFTEKKIARVFYVTITDADIGSQKSIHSLLYRYSDYMLVKIEQNRTKYTKF